MSLSPSQQAYVEKYGRLPPSKTKEYKSESSRKRRLNPEVRERERKNAREWRRNNPKRRTDHVKYMKKWRTENWEKYKIQQYRARGLPLPTRPMPETCEICGKTEKGRSLALDHDHETGRFRGWLCGHCNTGLGLFGDNVLGLMKAVNYLLKASE